MTALDQSIYYSLMFSSIVDRVVSCLTCVPIMYVTKMLLLYTDSMFCMACVQPSLHQPSAQDQLFRVRRVDSERIHYTCRQPQKMGSPTFRADNQSTERA